MPRKVKFNRETRLKAKTKVYAKALKSLYQPKISKKKLNAAGKFVARRTSTAHPKSKHLNGEYSGVVVPNIDYAKTKVFLSKELFKIPFKMSPKAKNTLIHELSHFFTLGKNHLVTASALGTYFGVKPKILSFKSKDGVYGALALASTWCSKEIVDGLLKGVVEENVSIGELEHMDNPFGRMSIAGEGLGAVARDLELISEKPGIGIFVIRDITMNKGIDLVLRNIYSGRYEKELVKWLKKNPSIRRALK